MSPNAQPTRVNRVSATSRTAVYGPVRTVVWEGRSREAPPYPDQFNLDGFRRNEAAGTHDQLGAAGLVAVEVHGDQAVDHVALSCQHSLHVGGGGARHDAKAIGVVNEI